MELADTQTKKEEKNARNLEPVIWSCDTNQRIHWFGYCQLTITWLSNIKDVRSKPRQYLQPISWSMAAFVVIVVVHTRPRTIPLAMFPSLSFMSMVLRLVALQVRIKRLWESRIQN